MISKIMHGVIRILRKMKNYLGRMIGRNYVDFVTKNKSIQENLIIFDSFFGRSITDNPLAIYNMLDKDKYECVFLVSKPADFPNFPTIRRKSLKAYRYMRMAKVIVNNSRMPKYWTKREGQVYLQTWHGTPLKKLVHDLTTFEMPSADSLEAYQDMFDADVIKWDYLISSCPYTTKCFRSAFEYQGEMLEIGYPRNHKLYHHTKTDIIKIKEELGIDPDKKVILYAPTYRDDQNQGVGEYYFNSELDFAKIKEEFPDSIILLRYHYIISDSDDYENENVINVSSYPEISDLYLVSDLLITDYSSVFFDYSILKKPFLFFTPDLDKYASELRGFYLDIMHDFPVVPVKTTSELIEQIKEIEEYDFESFSKEYNPGKNKNCEQEIVELFAKIINK